MEVEVKPDDVAALAEARKRQAKRRRELVRQFTDQFENATEEISPEWRRAIDNYKRAKGIKSVEVVNVEVVNTEK